MSAANDSQEISAKENRLGGSRTVARGTGSTPGEDKVQDDLQFQSESVAQFEDGSFLPIKLVWCFAVVLSGCAFQPAPPVCKV